MAKGPAQTLQHFAVAGGAVLPAFPLGRKAATTSRTSASNHPFVKAPFWRILVTCPRSRSRSFRQFLIELCECFDGYPAQDDQGRLYLGLVRNPGTVTAALGPSDLVDPPQLQPQAWQETSTYVRFTNRDKRFQEDSVAYRDRGNYQVTQAVLSQVLSRPWVTRQAVAQQIASASGRVAALPPLSGNLRVRKDRADGLAPGALFKLSFAQNNLSDLVCRVQSRTLPAPGQGATGIEFREDHGFLNQQHYVPADDAAPVQTVYAAQDLAYKTVIEAPFGLTLTQKPALIHLAARGDAVSNGFNLWRQESFGAYQNVGRREHFAAGQDIVAACDLSACRTDQDPVTEALAPAIGRTVLEVLTTGDVLRGTFTFEGATAPRTITSAQLVAALGSETDFKLRAWFDRSGFRSLHYDELTVRKV
jgi:hypothetical protein